MAKNENRCWPGYEPVPGKQQHEQGSCRKKAASAASPGKEKNHPGKLPSAAQGLKKRTAAKKTARSRPK